MNRILTMFLLVAAIATWTVETMNRERLVKRLDQARLSVRALPRAQAENADLVRRQPFVGELESLRRDRAELAALRRELIHREQSADATKAALSALGQDILPFMLWLPTIPMQDLGRMTPHAALQTFFAAANASSIPALRDTLAIEVATPRGMEHQVAMDPAYESAETHAAERLVSRAPFGEVQIMAERLEGFDGAVEFLAVRSPDGQVSTVALRMRWEEDGWRVVVPGHAGDPVPAGKPAPPANPLSNAPTLPEP